VEIAPHTRIALETLAKFIRPGQRILEIGCGSGANLAHLGKQVGQLDCHGIEPSAQAVEAGGRRYPAVQVCVGSADALPYADVNFDVVYFGFCLYLIDRELLFRAAAEADRVLKDSGFLGIIDFDPTVPRKRAYRHLQGVYSYKMNYAGLFQASGHYQLVAKTSYSHSQDQFHPDPAERVATTVLSKNIAAGYASEED
jgi:ubiquinone/menaquinone biosynthesis C-methylase UbiE